MTVLWFSVLFLSFGQLCVTQVIDINTIGSNYEITISCLTNEHDNTNIKFYVKWMSNYKTIFSYMAQSCIVQNINVNNTSANKCYNKVAVRHDNYEREYSEGISSTYLPSATYQISITPCYNTIEHCTGSTLDCSTDCKLPKTIYHHTPPRQPILNLKNITCKHLECEIHMNITNIQTSNSTLYGFQMKKEPPISRGFVKQLRDKGNNSNLIIPCNDPRNIITTLNNTDVCNNKTILLLVNDYMGLLNYTTKDLTNFRESANCELLNRLLSVTTVNNYYYLIIIPIVLILLGIIAFIKRKMLFKVLKNSNIKNPDEIKIDTTSQSLLIESNTSLDTKNVSSKDVTNLQYKS